ncbi:YceI family protein [uncultured Gimesia sp.]|uniref:YceI family protein n=1 Tax=uncultured Gimesia sp. TaxID=1678688 RepID=UPI0030DAA924|tara:strand:+ start:45985 stop:46650 length:666 start_codon:yes stop_codon:yes gene_type:complete
MSPRLANIPRKYCLLITGFVFLSFSLSANVQAQVATGEIDTKTSRVYTFVGKTGFGHEHAVIGEIKAGSLNLGARSNAGKIVFDMTTWKADTAEARKYIGLKGATSASTQKDVNANMLGSSVLNVRKYPTATFEITSAVPVKQNAPTGKSFYQLDGKFTLHGVTRNQRLIAEVTEKKHQNHVRTSFTIKQTHFGITPYSKAFGAVGITDELKIYGELDIAR